MDCITILMDFPRINGEERIEIIKKIGKYGFGYGAKVLTKLGDGDNICFYLPSQKSVVLKARVVGNLIEDIEPADPRIPYEYYDTEVILEDIEPVNPPVKLDDEKIRSQLEAFNDRNLKNWGWFVLGTHKVTESDFDILTNGK